MDASHPTKTGRFTPIISGVKKNYKSVAFCLSDYHILDISDLDRRYHDPF